MACPYFEPLTLRPACAPGSGSAMLPLGDAWAGVCHAVPSEPWEPDEAALRIHCNLGYARGECARFPLDGGPDAVRFAIARDEGACISVSYVVERDHHPFAHGSIEYSRTGETFVSPPASEIFGRQARAYLASYLRRMAEASKR